MDLHPSQLTRLRAFAAIGRHLSFTRAAEELRVTPSALSHHMRHLEAELGVTLILRLHRRIALTPSGERLLADCTLGFDALATAVRRFRADESAPLTVSVAPYFSARWLMPRLASLWARHPRLALQLRHAYQPADFLHDADDAGISWGHGQWPGVEARLILSGEMIAVCSAAFRRRLARRPTPEDLLGCRLLYEFDIAHWHRWFEASGVTVPRRLDAVQIDDSHALRRSILDGHGVGLFFAALAEEDVAAGLLHPLFERRIDPGAAYYFVTPRHRPRRPSLALFEKWLMREAGR